MVYSLTDKLKFTEPPKVEINGKVLTINNSAVNVLKLMDIVQTDGEIAGTKAVLELLFDEKDRKVIESLNLSMDDFVVFCTACMELAVGNDPDSTESER